MFAQQSNVCERPFKRHVERKGRGRSLRFIVHFNKFYIKSSEFVSYFQVQVFKPVNSFFSYQIQSNWRRNVGSHPKCDSFFVCSNFNSYAMSTTEFKILHPLLFKLNPSSFSFGFSIKDLFISLRLHIIIERAEVCKFNLRF